jgi:hypothetical protein
MKATSRCFGSKGRLLVSMPKHLEEGLKRHREKERRRNKHAVWFSICATLLSIVVVYHVLGVI